jgi:hypothetical protein
VPGLLSDGCGDPLTDLWGLLAATHPPPSPRLCLSSRFDVERSAPTPVLSIRERDGAPVVDSFCEKESNQQGASWASLRLAPLENMRITLPPPWVGESVGMR